MKRWLPVLLWLWASLLRAGDAPGSLLLEAGASKVTGGARYDGAPQNRCIRYWGSTNVVATWRVAVPARGTYRVFATYSCDPKVAGSSYEIQIGSQKANGAVQGTERWGVFKEFDLGPVIFRKPETVEVVVRGTRISRGTLWDLRSLRLVPEP